MDKTKLVTLRKSYTDVEWVRLGRHVLIQWLASKNLLEVWMEDFEVDGRVDGLEEALIKQETRIKTWRDITNTYAACPAYGRYHFNTDWMAVFKTWRAMCKKYNL